MPFDWSPWVIMGLDHLAARISIHTSSCGKAAHSCQSNYWSISFPSVSCSLAHAHTLSRLYRWRTRNTLHTCAFRSLNQYINAAVILLLLLLLIIIIVIGVQGCSLGSWMNICYTCTCTNTSGGWNLQLFECIVLPRHMSDLYSSSFRVCFGSILSASCCHFGQRF